MEINNLFDNRKQIAVNLKNCIRDKGFTKVSFSDRVKISRPTLDKLLNGEIDSKKSFDKHISKILNVLNLSADDLMTYQPIRTLTVQSVNSFNAPDKYQRDAKAQSEYELLLDVIDLCALYY